MKLQLRDIKLSYNSSHDEKLRLLRGVDLDVADGKVTALVGGNGTGKTTLFNIISGFEKEYTGNVLLDGRSIKRLSPSRIAQMGVGRLFQGGQLISGLTLIDNMKLASSDTTGEIPFSTLFHPRKLEQSEQKKEEKAREVLSRLFGGENEYMDMLDKEASEFSYGQQRLLSLASLMMGDKKLLLLDEPTSGVNPIYIELIEILINQLRSEGITILLIEHNMPFVGEIADTCAYLADGTISIVGPTAEVLNNETVRKSYLGQ